MERSDNGSPGRPRATGPAGSWRGAWAGVALAIAAAPAGASPSPPVLVPFSTGAAAAELVADGFEDPAPKHRTWERYEQGYEWASGAGRGGGGAIACGSADGKSGHGASRHIVLNQTSAAPIVVRGWSRAEDVGGAADADYALYVDAQYDDGTPLWGENAAFACGTHDWQRREFMILPEKPVRSLTLYCLFRHHSGRVWFDDVSLEQVSAGEASFLFQGRPMTTAPGLGRAFAWWPDRLRTGDGLQVSRSGDRVHALAVDGVRLPCGADGGFMAWDLASTGGVRRFERGVCAPLGLRLESTWSAARDHIAVEGSVRDTTGRDRAICLLFALPVDAAGWRWGDDLRRSRPIGGAGEYSKTVGVGAGATGAMSFYPLGAVWNDKAGLALALDMGRPAQYRIFHHAALKQLVLALDLGLAPETTTPGPGAASFRFVFYRFDPRDGFRGAFDRLMRIFPDYFAVREKRHGLWMPFTDVAQVSGWEDFGFRFHEGDNNVPFDDAHDILSFRYTEPMTWWMPLSNGVPRTPEAALAECARLAQSSGAHARRMAGLVAACGMQDANGRPPLRFLNTPWCNGAVWSLNPNPYLAAQPNAATVHWNGEILERLYGAEAKGRRDGEYLDSLEGYVTADLNFRRDHFGASTVPLSFDRESLRPALFKGLAVAEFTRWIGGDLHRIGRLLFANGVPYRYSFLCPWLDVLGTETDWLRKGQYAPASDETMCRWRTMAGGKPYLLLMNSDYDAFTPELVERYFQRALFWGMWPGFFSHNAAENPYWKNPEWYERDRPLFRRYLPLVRRVSEAGWQPVTRVACDHPSIYVERFGPAADGKTYVTVLNDTDEAQHGVLTLAPGFPKSGSRAELVSASAPVPATPSWTVELQPQQTLVFELAP